MEKKILLITGPVDLLTKPSIPNMILKSPCSEESAKIAPNTLGASGAEFE